MTQYENLRKHWPGLEMMGQSSGGQQQYDPLRSIHRCLIFLGDLARCASLPLFLEHGGVWRGRRNTGEVCGVRD